MAYSKVCRSTHIGNHLGDTVLSFAVQHALGAYNIGNISVAAQEKNSRTL
ncbi:MAG: hypothetical protein AB8U91_00180 [Candidatus Midichloria sp.]|uniref:Uncharacterized protein n=1 Tax=Hyalomma marginatum TaxID=34627 RepID=A0A8S4BTH0_9ACAR|nr:hypothetical protein MHYMCMPASI_00077 [Hyalomma marginatum]CAG7597828.1 hypothetical protein MHYMCMPSP_01075 [Hyalomma marginatum]